MLFDKYFPVIFITGGSIPKTDDRMETELLQSHGMIGQSGIVGSPCGHLTESHQIFTFHGIARLERGGHHSKIQTTVRQGFQNLRRRVVLDSYFNIRVSTLKIMKLLQQEQMQGGLGDTKLNGSGTDIFISAQFRFCIQQMLAGNGNMGVEPLSLLGKLQTSGFPQEQTTVQLLFQDVYDPGDIGLAAL